MDKKLTLNDTINVGKNKNVLISDLVHIKGEIFKYIKKGFDFDDEVLEKTGIKKTVRDFKTETVLVEHIKPKHIKVYPKETESLKNVLKSLHTLEYMEDDVDNTEDFSKDNEENIYTNNLTDLDNE